MRLVVLLCIAAALEGCASEAAVAVNTGRGVVTAVPPAGTTVYSGGLVYTSTSSSVAGVLAGIAFLGYAFYGREIVRWDELRSLDGTLVAPAPAPDRLIHEQDCTKPIENPLANLRCK